MNARNFGSDHCLYGVINHTKTAAGGKVVVSLGGITKISHVSCQNHKTWEFNEDQGGVVKIWKLINNDTRHPLRHHWWNVIHQKQEDDVIFNLALIFGCLIERFPFTYYIYAITDGNNKACKYILNILRTKSLLFNY